MLQRDYLMRRIEEMMQLIALALKFKHDGQFNESMKAIAQAYNEIPNIDRSTLAKMTVKEIEDFFLNSDMNASCFY